MGTTSAQATQYEAPRQLSDGNSIGTYLGQSPADIIGFYGNIGGVSQQSGAAQAAIVRGNAAGTVAVIKATSLTPTTVATITTAEYTFTAVVSTASASGWQVAANDILFVNKPTALAGVGVGNCRAISANSIGLTFQNYTGGTLTPTAQSYGFAAVRGLNPITAVLSPAAVQPNTTVEQQFSIPTLRGAAGALVQVIKPTAQAGIDIVGRRLVGKGVLGITFVNVTAATVTPTAAESYLVMEMAGIDALNNEIGINYLSSGAVTVATTAIAEQAWTVTGVTTTDMVVGMSKPTATASLGVGGWRVSAANTLGVTFVNVTTTNTPPTTDVWSIFLYRPNPAAPLLLYNQVLTPVSVAANTTAEQTFTVTGLVAGSIVDVNKPSAQAGLGIVGCRVSAASTLAITYGNSSAAAITPAAESYTIGNFQLPLGDAGSTWFQTVSLTSHSQSILTNALRSAFVSLGMIAGA